MAASVVIKVKYGDTLRRLNAEISGNGELNLTMDDLKNKISSLFSFQPDTELVLTYIDEDDDVVTLANDDDLHDVVRQALNPLRITVKVDAGKSGLKFPMDDNGASEFLESLSEHMQKSLESLDNDFSQLMRTPLQAKSQKQSAKLAAEKLLADLRTNKSLSIAEIVDHFAKMMGLPGVSSTSKEEGTSETKPATL